MRRAILKLIHEQSPQRPACFDTHSEWVEWLASAHAGGAKVVRREDVGKHAGNRVTRFEVLPVGLQSHCQDCNQIRQERMQSEKRCFPVRTRTSTSDACQICQRDPKAVNNEFAECSHVDCTHRRKCWSNGTAVAHVEPVRRARGPFDALFEKVEV